MPDTELQSRFRELLSLHNGASGVIDIILEEMFKEFRDNPAATLVAANREYNNRVRKSMDALVLPESPIELFYPPRLYNITSEQVLINQLKDMKETVPDLYTKAAAKVGLTVDSPISEVARAVGIAAEKMEKQLANSI